MTAGPRNWKDFEGRWTKSSRIEKFIIISVLLHLIIATSWAIPRYWAYRLKQEVLAKKVEQEKKEKEKVQKQFTDAEKAVQEQSRRDIAETQLREFYERLTKDLLSDEEMEKRWEELMKDLAPELSELDELLLAEEYDELKMDERVMELREKMVDKLHDSVAKDLQEEWKKRYLKYLEEVSKKLAETFQKELANRIGTPLNRDVQQILERELAGVKKDINKSVSDMQAVKREADRQKERIDQSNKRIVKGIEKNNDEGKKQIANEEAVARETAGKLDDIKKPIGETSDRLKDIAPAVASKVALIKDTSVENAVTAAKSEAENISKAQPKDALTYGEKALASATETSTAAEAVIKEISEISPEQVVAMRLRALLAALEKEELQNAFKNAFDKEYEDNAYAQLFDLLNKQFQEEARKRGIVPPPLSIEEELAKLLGIELPKMTDAGVTTTSNLREKQELAKYQDKPGEGELEKRTGDAVKGAANGLIEREMKNVVSSALGNKGTWLLASGAELDEKGQWNVALLDRLGNLKNQMGEGRREFLGRGDNAALLNARQRNLSLSRARGRLSHYYDSGFDQATFLTMIEKMKNRGVSAQGEAFTLQGERGEATKAEEADGLKPEMILVGTAVEDTMAQKTPEQEAKREVRKPEFKYNEFTGIPYLNHPIKIDGDLSDWQEQKVPKLTMALAEKGPKGKQFPSQDFWLAYDARGLYIAVDAKDTTGALENHLPLNLFWENDCIEVFVDSQNTKYARRGEQHTHQFFVFPFGQKDDPDAGGYEAVFDSKARWIPDIPRFSQEVMPRAGKKTEQGWAIEFLIPKEVIRRGELKPGRIIGFTISCCTGSDVYYYWSFNEKLRTSESPNTWGDIQLLGSDAALSLLDKEGEKMTGGVFPGEPIHIQVEDGDMNLDNAVKDKVRVNVSAASGDYEQVILEETATSSGVFDGSLATRLNIGNLSTGVLDLYEGEDVKVEYIDQAQAYGERDVRVTKGFKAASGGTTFVQK